MVFIKQCVWLSTVWCISRSAHTNSTHVDHQLGKYNTKHKRFGFFNIIFAEILLSIVLIGYAEKKKASDSLTNARAVISLQRH